MSDSSSKMLSVGEGICYRKLYLTGRYTLREFISHRNVSLFSLYCYDKDHDQWQLGEEEGLSLLTGHSPSWREARSGTQGRKELKQKPCSSAPYWLALSGLLGYLSCATHKHLPKVGTTRSEIDPPTSPINQENVSQNFNRVELFS